MRSERLPSIGRLIAAAAAIVALAAMQWWVTVGALTLAGVLTGVALAALVAIGFALSDVQQPAWAAPAGAAVIAMAELFLGCVALSALAGVAIMLLPPSATVHLMSDDLAADIVLFAFLGLAVMSGARGWWRYSRQQAEVVAAQIASVQAQALVDQRERELVQSQLMLLRAQVEPHFLWNTLAHVQHLVRKNPADAELMTGHLIRYLRAAVPQMRRDASTVASEMESVRAYLELMKIRMGERLFIGIEVADDAGALALAPLIVQTLVENAIKHGIEPKVGPASVLVRAWCDGETESARLNIEVRDNGVGLRASAARPGAGMGLRSVRERLRLMYGAEASLAITGAPGGGVVATICVPCNGAAA